MYRRNIIFDFRKPTHYAAKELLPPPPSSQPYGILVCVNMLQANFDMVYTPKASLLSLQLPSIYENFNRDGTDKSTDLFRRNFFPYKATAS